MGVPLGIQPSDDDRHLEAVLVTGQTDAQPLRALVQPHVVKLSVLPVLALDLTWCISLFYLSIYLWSGGIAIKAAWFL